MTTSGPRLIAVLACAIAASTAEAAGFHEPWTETGTFVSAPDGDTLKVKTPERGLVTVRVAGVDTPERGQGYWRAARSHLVALVTSGNLNITCYKTDQYKREICTVKARDGDLGASLLLAGLAWHYKRYQDEQEPAERALYAQLEKKARDSRAGLWQQPDPMPPEVCRKARRASQKRH